MKKRSILLVMLAVLLLSAVGVRAQAPVELRITWYDDGTEGVVLRDLLDRFEAENPDIRVIVDTVPYIQVLDQLPLQVEAGEAPDMARVTAGERYRGSYLDLRPYLADPAYWEASFPAAVLQWLRSPDEEGDPIYGFPNQFTVTGPYINRTLFEQAGVEVPSDSSDAVTWEQWTEAAAQVAAATEVYGIAIDRSGHRFAGPAFTEGATYFDEAGNFSVDTEGFRAMAQLLIDWHTNGLTPAEVWIGSGGTYAQGAPFFVSGELAVYMSGSWQIGNFAANIGDAFDWEAVPNPTGPGGSTGMPGGTVFVAFAQTEHPEEVARVMEYLASADVYREFVERTLFIPGHQNLGELDYQTELPAAKSALEVFAAEALNLDDQAYALQYGPSAFAINNPVRDRLTQAITGELSLDDAVARIQEDVDAALAAAAVS
ncbi:MAG: extracellular solute-binding protein [Chloroflexota bacterium]|nr:extracellular solute-binding protein [Chloroflexota bacterium]